MIRRSNEKEIVTKPSPFNDAGEITVRSLLNGPEEMNAIADLRPWLMHE